jgi:hypothetical protein
MVSAPVVSALASAKACRSDPGPASLLVVRVKVVAAAGSLVAVSPSGTVAKVHSAARSALRSLRSWAHVA